MAVTAAVREVTEVEGYGENSSGDVRRGTVASGTDIPKGTILKLATPETYSASTGTGDVFGGIANADKEGDDPSTSLGAWENGIYEFTASGAIIAGQKVKTADPGQYVMAALDADVTSSYSIIVGVARKTVADGARVQVRVDN